MSDEKDQIQNTEIPTMPIVVNAQYVKDLSFENPNPIESLQASDKTPEIAININVTAKPVAESAYEVSLLLKAEAVRDEKPMFIVELDYSGIFSIGDIPEETIKPLLMIECPRILFPYARGIIANTTREGGYPALSINPIDFAELYRNQGGEAQTESTESESKTVN